MGAREPAVAASRLRVRRRGSRRNPTLVAREYSGAVADESAFAQAAEPLTGGRERHEVDLVLLQGQAQSPGFERAVVPIYLDVEAGVALLHVDRHGGAARDDERRGARTAQGQGAGKRSPRRSGAKAGSPRPWRA